MWLDGATGPAVGARFASLNKVPKRPAWTNKPVITVVEPDGDGTLVTESYRVTRPLSRIGWFVIGVLFARPDRRTDLRDGMEQTLQRLRDAVENAHVADSNT